MDKHYLNALYAPASIVVLGGGDGAAAALRAGGFSGALAVLDPARAHGGAPPVLAGFAQGRPELALIDVAPALAGPALALAARLGCRAALIVGAPVEDGAAAALRATARRQGMQLLGPNCRGMQRPGLLLNAGAAGPMAAPGRLALVSQSGALSDAIIDWAACNAVGFSSIVSLDRHGAADLAQTLDFLAADALTRAIVVYMEEPGDARRFMSALRAAARSKPVVVLKAGRAGGDADAGIGAEEAFEAALRRAGAVRVHTFVELFTAAKTLASRSSPVGARLAVVTNGGGPGLLAADRLAALGRPLACLAPATLAALAPQLPAAARLVGVIDLSREAGADHYRAAVAACDGDASVDAVLVVYAPVAGSDPLAVAGALVGLQGQRNKPLLACWMGERHVAAARQALGAAAIASFRTPEAAVEAFHHIAAFYQNQQLLRQVPPPLSQLAAPDIEGARLLIERVLAAGRGVLTEMESKALLAAFHIPVTQTMLARDAGEAMLIASQLGYPVALKIDSSDIARKSDVCGVVLDVRSAGGVREAHHDMLATVARLMPHAVVNAVTVQKMAGKKQGRELSIGVSTDRRFGPVIAFGAGGTMSALIADHAVELPPLNQFLAGRLIGRARIAGMLGEGAVAALEQILLRVSEMVCVLPQLREIDINPLIVDEAGAVAVDARIVIGAAPPGARPDDHLAILPYPSDCEWELPLRDGALCTLRPIRPADASMLQDFMRGLSSQARYYRFVSMAREHSEAMLAQFTLIDYDREMALVALERRRVALDDGTFAETASIIGVARYVANPGRSSCEFALVVGDAHTGQGLGTRLMQALMDLARERGLSAMEGLVLARNQPMLRLMQRLGFAIGPYDEDRDFRLCRTVL